MKSICVTTRRRNASSTGVRYNTYFYVYLCRMPAQTCLKKETRFCFSRPTTRESVDRLCVISAVAVRTVYMYTQWDSPLVHTFFTASLFRSYSVEPCPYFPREVRSRQWDYTYVSYSIDTCPGVFLVHSTYQASGIRRSRHRDFVGSFEERIARF